MQPELEGAPLERAQTILNLPSGSFDLKRLVTEDNLKRVGFLSARVGSIIPFQKFKKGVPLKSTTQQTHHIDEENLEGENVNQNEGASSDFGIQ